MTDENNKKESQQTEKYWLKLLLGIFVATEDINRPASEFVKKARGSDKVRVIWALASFFWISLICVIFVSVLFFKNSDTLFNVVASTEKVDITAYNNRDDEKNPYPDLLLENIKLYNDCDDVASVVSGILVINKNSSIELVRVGTGKLFVTLNSDEEEPVGEIDGFSEGLSDCVTLEFSPTSEMSFTIPIDGLVEIGGEVKESMVRMPILREGTIHIADKAVLSQEYYLAEPYDLTIGDKFSIDGQSVQSSGFVLIDNNPGMKITYASKGSVGVIERYKTEKITLKNSFWTKLYNDETVVILWLLFVALYTLIKVAIRFCIE